MALVTITRLLAAVEHPVLRVEAQFCDSCVNGWLLFAEPDPA